LSRSDIPGENFCFPLVLGIVNCESGNVGRIPREFFPNLEMWERVLSKGRILERIDCPWDKPFFCGELPLGRNCGNVVENWGTLFEERRFPELFLFEL